MSAWGEQDHRQRRRQRRERRDWAAAFVWLGILVFLSAFWGFIGYEIWQGIR